MITNTWYVPGAVLPDSFARGLPRGILHNPDLYPDPETFNPERFLNKDGTFRDDPTISLAFGGGKRICPGRHLVDTTLFIVTASVLSVFNVIKATDENGHEIPVNPAIEVDSLVWYVALTAAIFRPSLVGPLQPSGEVRVFRHCKRQGRRRLDCGECFGLTSCPRPLSFHSCTNIPPNSCAI